MRRAPINERLKAATLSYRLADGGIGGLRLRLLSGAGMCLFLLTPSWPQQTESPAAAATPGDSSLGEIIVTARRRNESLEDVPVAITAFSSQELENKHIVNAVDLATFSPSMVSQTTNSNADEPTFAIRGQATTQFGAPGVIVYFAEVPVSFFGLSAIDGRPGSYYDLENVQVLNGPQGTLFGKNATGGSILFVPKKPTDDFGGYMQVEAGDFNDRRVQGAVNIPLTDAVLFRVAGEIDRRTGYVTDVGPYYPGKDYDNVDDESVRASLLIRPFDGFESYSMFRWYHQDTNGSGYYFGAFNPGASFGLITALYPTIQSYLTQSMANGVYHTSSDLDQRNLYNYWQGINTTTYQLTAGLSLKNIVSYAQYRATETYNLAGTPFPLFEIITPPGQYYNAPDLFTEELQLQGKVFDEALTFSGGVYYDRQSNSNPHFTSILQPLNFLFGGNPSQPLDTMGYFETDSHAAFAQGNYDLGKVTPALTGLSLTAGYRYTWESVTSDYFLDKVPDQGPAINANTFDYGSYTFGIDYKITKDLLSYITARSAAKSGGSNLYQPIGSPYLNFAPERIKDVEIGIKADSSIGGMSTRANLAVYRGNYSNIQRTVDVTYMGVPAFITLNTAEAVVKGAEFQGDFSPIRALTFSVSYAYIDSAYTGSSSAAGVNLVGGPFPYTPRNKATVGATANLPLGTNIGTLSFNVTDTYQSGESTADTIPYFVQSIPGFKLINLRLTWEEVMGQAPLQIAAFVTNAANEQYVTSVNDGYYKPFGSVSYGYGEPRMFGAQLTYHFGK
jgi:iron complex outermembrane receptor protein